MELVETTRDLGPSAVRGHLADPLREKALRPGLLTFLRAAVVWLITLAGIVFLPWWAKVPLAVLNGAIVGTLFIVGHDACHGVLMPRRWMNRLAGRLCLLPSLHPYTAWVHNHNRLHHAFTNIKEKDPGFPPLSPAEYRALSAWGRWLYRQKRTWYGLGVLYFLDMWAKWEVFPTAGRAPKNPRAYTWDRLLVFAFAAVWVGGLALAGWWTGDGALELVLVGFVLPQAVWNWLAAFIILQQHTHPRVPWFSEPDLPAPTYFDGQVRATPHVVLTPPFRVLMRYVMEHTAHHVDPLVPHYHLTDAQAALESAYHGEIVREDWTIRTFLRTLRTCRLYDYDAHRWVDYDGAPLTEPLRARA